MLRRSTEQIYDPTGTILLCQLTRAEVRFPGGISGNPRNLVPPPEPGMRRTMVNVHLKSPDVLQYEVSDSYHAPGFPSTSDGGDVPVVVG